jgi:protein-tyrosine phosphatase
MSYVDLHLHLLPGVDDGAVDERASLEHAARMAAGGIHEATVTPHIGHPHFAVDPFTIAERTAALQRAIDDAGIELRLHPGGEIHPLAGDLSAAELDLIAQGPRGARWVLAEVPFAGVTAEFVEGCGEIRHRGFGLVIAHPERAWDVLASGLGHLRTLIGSGAVLQVNVDSLQGAHGPDIQDAAETLIRSRFAYVIASDGHPGTRVQTLDQGESLAIAAGASPAYAHQLTAANPRFLVRNGLSAAAVVRRRTRRSVTGRRVEAARDAAARLRHGGHAAASARRR